MTTKTYEELEAIEAAERQQDRARVLHMLGLLTPNMSALEVLVLHGKVCDDKEAWKRWSDSYGPQGEGQLSTLEILQAMKPTERAALRARVTR
jgi:hypothetical protein